MALAIYFCRRKDPNNKGHISEKDFASVLIGRRRDRSPHQSGKKATLSALSRHPMLANMSNGSTSHTEHNELAFNSVSTEAASTIP